jgi:hypothetical protein
MDSDLSGDDDESDSEDGEEEVSALDPNSQQRPKLPIYHPGFRLTEKLTMGILSNFLDFFEQAEKYGYRDEEMPYLKKKVEYSKTIPYQGAVKLAVAGDTGAGKSALLNAVLGVLNLTIEVREASDYLIEHHLISSSERWRGSLYMRHHGVSTISFDPN